MVKSSQSSRPRTQVPSSPLSNTMLQSEASISKSKITAESVDSKGNDSETVVASSEADTNKAVKVAPFGNHTSSEMMAEQHTSDTDTASGNKPTVSELPKSGPTAVPAQTRKFVPNFPNLFGPLIKTGEKPTDKPADNKPTEKPAEKLSKSTNKPTPIITSIESPNKKLTAATTPTTPTKRTADPATTIIPDLKRTKLMASPSTPSSTKRTKTASSSPYPMSIELQVAEQRKRLEVMRKKREEMAQKQTALDEEMAPYKQRMLEELERIKQEMADEESALAEEEERFKASAEMLEEFKNDAA